MVHNRIRLIQQVVAIIDRALNNQLNTILHQPRFQQLEAGWRALYYLTGQLAEANNSFIKIKIVSISWAEIGRDITRAMEFDQSQLFHKIYSNEFGHPGGEPFGLLIGNYNLSHRWCQAQRASDMTVLRVLAKIAAAAFAPFIAAADPALFGLESFVGFERALDLERTFQQLEYRDWQILRSDEDSRFIGLILPRVLLRMPYQDQLTLRKYFCFSEKIKSIDDYLWGNTAFYFAAAAIRAFAKSGWFADLQGEKWLNFPTQYATDIRITDRQEKNLSDFGFMTLNIGKYSRLNAIYTCASIQKIKQYNSKNATQNAKISGMLHYILCVSRFAHYIKIIFRDKVGTFVTAQECENFLRSWLNQYTAAGADMSDELKAQYPLREAQVQVHETLGNAGSYFCTLHLSPHYQFDHVESYLKLTTQLIRGT